MDEGIQSEVRARIREDEDKQADHNDHFIVDELRDVERGKADGGEVA
jgi:hypothetical protein